MDSINPLLTPDEKSHKTARKQKWETSGCHFAWQCSVCLPWWVGITYLNLFAGRLYKTTGSPHFLGWADSQWDREPLIRLELLWSTGAPPSLSLSLSLYLFLSLIPPSGFQTERSWGESHPLFFSPSFSLSLPLHLIHTCINTSNT